MSYRSGVGGKVLIGSSSIAGITGWEATFTSNNPKFVTAQDEGHQNSVQASKNAAVSANVIHNTDAPVESLFEVGDAVTLLCYEDATRLWTFPVRVETIGRSVQIENQAITVPCTFSSRGRWTDPDGNQSKVPS